MNCGSVYLVGGNTGKYFYKILNFDVFCFVLRVQRMSLWFSFCIEHLKLQLRKNIGVFYLLTGVKRTTIHSFTLSYS